MDQGGLICFNSLYIEFKMKILLKKLILALLSSSVSKDQFGISTVITNTKSVLFPTRTLKVIEFRLKANRN